MNNLTGLFDTVNEKVGDISNQVGQTPAAWNSSVYTMIHTLSENVIVPIAGLILAFIMTLEFIQISFINHSANRDSYSQNLEIPLQGDDFDAIRQEYTDMLKNQLAD